VGRTPDNAVQLLEDSVSRHHATLWVQADQVLIRDEGTSNGTFVRGERIPAQSPHPIQPGDEIRIGTATFILAVAQPAAVAAAEAPSRAPSQAMWVLGGAVLAGVLLMVLIMFMVGRGGPAQTVLPPSLTPTPSATQPPVTPSATPASVTATATPLARPVVVPATPTATPSSLITLIEPANGASFGGSNAYILLRWKPERPLASGEVYLVTLDCQRQVSIPAETGRTDQTQWQVPAHVYNALTDAGQCRWWVNIASSAGNPVSPPSATWTFTWAKEKEPGGTPGMDK
jgi:pSer/pThr/pTyr-binding forkhead associated (FHA) protein